MSVTSADGPAGFYFALPRLAARIGGQRLDRSSRNSAEAYAVSGAIFLVTFSLASRLVSTQSIGLATVMLLLLALATFIFWLITLAVHSLGITALRACGWLCAYPNDRLQGAFILLETTGFALLLWRHAGWTSVVGGSWLLVVALNVTAAVLLRIVDAQNRAVA